MPRTTLPLSPSHWRYLKSLPPCTERWFHISAPIIRVTNPVTGVSTPFAQRPGSTYNVGHNAAKREARRARVRRISP